jgi:hypothetical protein
MLFSLDQNVLWYRATLQDIGPLLTVSNEFFTYRKTFASLDPSPVQSIAVPAGEPVTILAEAQPVIGRQVDGYRWALDLAAIDDETPRKNEKDLAHWSAWSLIDHDPQLGPFPAGDAKKPPHLYYLEARDDLGGVNLVVVEIAVQARLRPPGQLLLVDDMYGVPTEPNPDGTVYYKGAFPMEAEQDSFYNAVGGVPDVLKRIGVPGADPNALSAAGAFAGFDYDTLDYRFWPEEGIDVLTQYARGRVVLGRRERRALRQQVRQRVARDAPQDDQLGAAGEHARRLRRQRREALAVRRGCDERDRERLLEPDRPGRGAPAVHDGGHAGRHPRARNFLDFCHLRSQLITGGLASSPTLTRTAASRLHPVPAQFAGPASRTIARTIPASGPPQPARRPLERAAALTLAGYRGANANRTRARHGVLDHGAARDPRGNRSSPSSTRSTSTRRSSTTRRARPRCRPTASPTRSTTTAPERRWGGSGFSLHYFELAQVRQVVRS